MLFAQSASVALRSCQQVITSLLDMWAAWVPGLGFSFTVVNMVLPVVAEWQPGG
jgi:hypothetical protein